jgi:hypothetical protein
VGDSHWRTIAIMTVCTVWSVLVPFIAVRVPRWPAWALSTLFVVGTVGLFPALGLRTVVLAWLAVMLAVTAAAIVYLDWEDSNGPAVAWVGTLLGLVMLWTNGGRSLWTVIAYGGAILLIALAWHNWSTIVELSRVSRRSAPATWTAPPLSAARDPRRNPGRPVHAATPEAPPAQRTVRPGGA